MNRPSLLASALLATTPLSFVLPGCGGSSGGPTPTATPTATAIPSATATATAGPTNTPSRPVREYYVRVAPAQVIEGDSGQKLMNFVITGIDTHGEQTPITFSYKTIDGTAIVGQDYIAVSGEGSVTTGSTTTISVPILGDTLIEEDETFVLQLSNMRALYSTVEAIGTIKSNERPTPTPTSTSTPFINGN